MPGALEVLQAPGDLHVHGFRRRCNTVWECPLWRPAGCSAEAAVTGKQALQSALGLDGSSVQALAKPVTNEAHVFL